MTGGHERPHLSVILPVYAAAALAARSVTTLIRYLSALGYRWEIVVVDDGGNDFLTHPLPHHPSVRFHRHETNRGKGAAIRTGMLAATGEVRIYTDADLPYDLELLPTLRAHILSGFHLAVGDRTLPGSTYVQRTGSRGALSAVASAFIGSLVTGGFYDTQCGLKALRADVAEELFGLVSISGFAFDVELIYLALKHRLDIKRVPVQLRRDETSSVRVMRDSIHSVVDILGIKARQLRGAYRSPTLEAIVEHEARLAREPWRRVDNPVDGKTPGS